MDILSALGAALIFSLACNLDTVLAAVGTVSCGHVPGLWDALLISTMTTLITYCSLLAGAVSGTLFPGILAGQLGGLALIGMGLWYLAESVWGRDGAPDSARSRALCSLAAVLAVNNAGAGFAAGLAGLPPALAALCNFFVTPAALLLGRLLGGRLTRWSRLALPLSGTLLALLGLWQLLQIT